MAAVDLIGSCGVVLVLPGFVLAISGSSFTPSGGCPLGRLEVGLRVPEIASESRSVFLGYVCEIALDCACFLAILLIVLLGEIP